MTPNEEICKVEKIPILKDNFVFVLHRGLDCVVVDPGEAAATLEYLEKQKLNLKAIIITHHHGDHVDGVLGILQRHSCPVYGPATEKIPGLTNPLRAGDVISLLGLDTEIKLLPGHTLGHIAYWLGEKKWLFSGDVLFALGCGRLFEGTPRQMYQSLEEIKTLPDESLIFCTHDYFATNKSFCDSQGLNTNEYESIHPLVLGQEKEFNPFLTAPDLEIFTARRTARNHF